MKYEEFERIYQEYYLKILTFIHKRVPDLYEAEELTGDVFLSFYRNMDSYDEEKGSIATWLYAITANRLKNYYRDKDSLFSGNPEAARQFPGKNAGGDCGKDYERRDIKKKSGAAF
ncbi:MAG: sigma-70 family RNA polymerase sigma factor [Blautia faecis]